MDNNDSDIEIWKIKNLIKQLDKAKGNGTSMISLIIPPKDQIARVSKLLTEESGTASNIKSRVNRLSVLGAIVSVQNRLKLYSRVPPNGLIIYCGTIITEEGKEKKVNFDFEPFRPINTSLYLCDSKFHTEALASLLDDEEKFGFVIMDGNGSLFGTVQGNTKEVLHRFTVDLPKKHGRGGQSALRFARLRNEKRHNYIRKVAEEAVRLFVSDNRPNVTGLILAGSADFKTELGKSDMFDPRLLSIVIKSVDIAYGGENGFNQAIMLSEDSLQNVKFVQEIKLLKKYFNEIARDTQKYCFGVEDTIKCMEMGACETVMCWENSDADLRTQEGSVHLARDSDTCEQPIPLLEWLVNNYKKFGTKLEIISDRSSEGYQFVKGFGGIGAVLRYKVDLESLQVDEEYSF